MFICFTALNRFYLVDIIVLALVTSSPMLIFQFTFYISLHIILIRLAFGYFWLNSASLFLAFAFCVSGWS